MMQPVLHLVPEAGAAQRFLDDLVQFLLDCASCRGCAGRRRRCRRSISGTGSASGTPCRRASAAPPDRRRWRRRSCRRSASAPATRQPSMVSFMRLMQRRNVVLPQPDGPMKAVTARSGMSMRDVEQRLLVAVEHVDVARADFGGARRAIEPARRFHQPARSWSSRACVRPSARSRKLVHAGYPWRRPQRRRLNPQRSRLPLIRGFA